MGHPCKSAAPARSALLLLRRPSGCFPALGSWPATSWPAYFGRSMAHVRPSPRLEERSVEGRDRRALLPYPPLIFLRDPLGVGERYVISSGTKQILCDGFESPCQRPIGVGFWGGDRIGFVTGSSGGEDPADGHRVHV